MWSPEQISAIGDIIGRPVSHEWIYQHVSGDKVQGGKLYKLLRQGKRRYRKGYGKKRSPIPDAVSIEQRPAWLMNAAGLGTGKLTWFWVSKALEHRYAGRT
ncbi:hypothetical protein EWM60_11100 [Candidatus Erwinia dacicola]|nr:hypothetical protein [Candidatus Erwinia dacicola]